MWAAFFLTALWLPVGCQSLARELSQLYQEFDADVKRLLGDTLISEDAAVADSPTPWGAPPGALPGVPADNDQSATAADSASPPIAAAGAPAAPVAPSVSPRTAAADAPATPAAGSQPPPAAEADAPEAPSWVYLQPPATAAADAPATPAAGSQSSPAAEAGSAYIPPTAADLEAAAEPQGNRQDSTAQELDAVLARTRQIAQTVARDSDMLAKELGVLQSDLQSRKIHRRDTAAGGEAANQPTGDQACNDTDNGAVDYSAYTCRNGYHSPALCGIYDDEDFSSNDMCCNCGGGQAGVSAAARAPGAAPAGRRTGGAAGNQTDSWLERKTIKSDFLTWNHKLADFPACAFWAGISLLSVVICCSCCVRPMFRRRQEAREGRLL